MPRSRRGRTCCACPEPVSRRKSPTATATHQLCVAAADHRRHQARRSGGQGSRRVDGHLGRSQRRSSNAATAPGCHQCGHGQEPVVHGPARQQLQQHHPKAVCKGKRRSMMKHVKGEFGRIHARRNVYRMRNSMTAPKAEGACTAQTCLARAPPPPPTCTHPRACQGVPLLPPQVRCTQVCPAQTSMRVTWAIRRAPLHIGNRGRVTRTVPTTCTVNP